MKESVAVLPAALARPACLFRQSNSRARHPAEGDAFEGRQVHFPPRALIFQEGDPARSFFQIGEGTVMLYQLLPDGRRQVVEFLQAGDVFGFSDGTVRDCTAETLVPTSCTLFEGSQSTGALARRLNASLLAQLHRLHEQVTLLGRKSAAERVASFLMRFIPGRGRGKCPGPPKEDDQARVPLPMTRLEIADFLGLTIETVSRVLTRLKRRGILFGKKLDEIGVTDVCQLCRLSGTHLVNGRWCSSHGEMQRPEGPR